MRTAVAVIAAIVLIALGLIFLFFMANVTGLPLCSEFAPGADECIDSTSAGRVAGLITGWAATLCTALGTLLGLRWATAKRGAGVFAITALAAPLLALATGFLIPVEF